MTLAVAGSLTSLVSPAADAATNTYGTCRGGSLTKYGYRTSCETGSFYARVRAGSIDDTFAIRGDRAIVYSSPNHGWVRVSNGLADYVKWVDATSNGLEGVCVETSSGHLYYSSYDRHRGWSHFTVGCEAG